MDSGGFSIRLQPPFTFERVVSFVAVVFLSFIIFSQYSNLGSSSGTIGLHDSSVDTVNTHPRAQSVFSLVTKVPTCSQFASLQTTIGVSKSKIWKNWNVSSYPNFLHLMHIPSESWNIQKAAFVQLLLKETVHEPFVVGFSGSSVTAGHDNYFLEAYPNVFYEAMLPSMSLLLDGSLNSSLFVVRNHALGNNPCYAYDACIETHLGGDLDILTWEQSMNCGHDPKFIDTFARSSYAMPKKPVLWFLQSGTPFWTPEDCVKGNLSDALRPKTSLTPEEVQLLNSPLRDSAAASGHMSRMDFLKESGSGVSLVERFADLAPMGQNVFDCEAYKCRGPYNSLFSAKTEGGGANWHPGRLGHKLRGENLAYYLLSMLGEAVQDVSTLMCDTTTVAPTKTAARPKDAISSIGAAINSLTHVRSSTGSGSGSSVVRGSPVGTVGCNMTTLNSTRTALSKAAALSKANDNVVRFVRRHPSIGKIELSYASVKYLDELVTLVGSTLKLGEVSKEQSKNIHFWIGHSLMQEELQYNGSGSSVVASQRQRIVATALREFSSQYLLRPPRAAPLLEVPASYDVSETNLAGSSSSSGSGSRHECLTDYQPRMSHSLSERVVESNWTLDLSFFDKAAVLKNENKHFGYLDRKMVHTSNGPGSRIAIRIHSLGANPLWLCELQKGFGKYPAATMGDLNKEALVYVMDNYTPGMTVPRDYSGMQKLELVDFSDQCYRTTTKVPAGDHLLLIVQKGALQVNIAYVVSW